MIIEDAELRELYKVATGERLQNMEAGLMHLEKHPGDLTMLEQFLREAHTLKGDSRMLGVQEVETLVHQVEETLGTVKRGESSLTDELCDRLYRGLDAINKLVHEAVTGEASDVNVFYTLAQLMGAVDDAATEAPSTLQMDDFLLADTLDEAPGLNDDCLLPDSVPEIPQILREQLEIEPLSVPAPVAQTAVAQVSDYQIDTIRVEPQRLDVLMTQASELTFTKQRMAQQMTEIEEIVALWEEWSQEALGSRLALDLERVLPNDDLQPVYHFHQRAQQRLERLGILINQLKTQASEDNTSLDTAANQLESGIKSLRLLPLSNLFNLFPRMVRDLAKQQSKAVNLVIEGGDTLADRRILEEMRDPLLHLMRNAIDHGIETPQERESFGKSRTATIRLRGYQTGSKIAIEITDDGRGLNIQSIKRTVRQKGIYSEEELAQMTTSQIQSLIFIPGFSTRTTVTELSGRGVGLDVVRANVERLKGTIETNSTPGMGCRFCIQLSTTLTTTQVLIVEVNQRSHAIPVEFVQTTLLVSLQEFAFEGSPTIAFEDRSIPVVWLADLLELPVSTPASPQVANTIARMLPCIILKIGTEWLGLLVDDLLDQQDIVLKPQSKLLRRIRNVSGATILGTGKVCMVLNPQDLLRSVQRQKVFNTPKIVEQTKTKRSLLLVEDSIIIRTQLKRLLEAAGYEVTAAVDGIDGLGKLKAGQFDAVVSDIEMPNLDGWALTASIRQQQEYTTLPIILVTTLASDEDKRRGAEAGANAYITKGAFDQKVLLNELRRLIQDSPAIDY